MDQPGVNGIERLQEVYSGRVAAHGSDRAACVPPDAILAVIRREGSEEDRLATLDHVMNCADCHREYEWLTAVDDAASGHDPAVRGTIRPWWQRGPALALAATVVLAVGIAVAPRLLRHDQTEPERGGAGDIVLVAPAIEAVAPSSLTFVWRPAPGAGRYVLEIQNTDGKVVLSDTTSDTTATLAAGDRLTPGATYRWWVREDGVSAPRSSPFGTVTLGR